MIEFNKVIIPICFKVIIFKVINVDVVLFFKKINHYYSYYAFIIIGAITSSL